MPYRKPDEPPSTVRPCLGCKRPMKSAGPHHRFCDACRKRMDKEREGTADRTPDRRWNGIPFDREE